MNTSLQDLEDRSYLTYLARVQAWKRLAGRERAWNTFLIAFGVSSVIASIVLLVSPSLYGPYGGVFLVCVAVLSLTASLVVPSLNYAARARDMFSSYRRLQRLSSEVERLRKSGETEESPVARELFERYQSLLDESENHSESDYQLGLQQKLEGEARRRTADPAQTQAGELELVGSHPSQVIPKRVGSAVGFLPYVSLVVPIGLLVPIVFEFFRGF